MTTTRTTPFEELTRLASDFVTAQKGMWDHKAWLDFVSRVQHKGIEISDEMQARLGDLLEAMKEYHMAVSSTENVEKATSTVLDACVAFIKRQRGVWGHAEWEDFLKTMQENAHIWSEGMEAYLGGVLESLKVFYRLSSAAPATIAAPARRAAPAKKSPSAASRKVSRRPASAKTSKQSGKKKAV